VTTGMHPAAPHHLPFFITPPGETDVLMVGTGIFLVAAVLGVGVLYWRLHALPEHIAHRSHKLQLEIVAVLGRYRCSRICTFSGLSVCCSP
jgi:hypothetical protein